MMLIATESPIFTWVGFGLEPVSGDAGGIMPDREYRATATVKNVGRSPLELRAVCIETMLGQEERHSGFGAIPKYTDIVNAGHVLEAGKEVRFYSVKRVKFTADEAAGVKNLSRHFWIYGFVRYFNRFTDEVCDAGFSVMRTDSGFHRIGIPNYNYDRRQKANPDKPVPFPYQT